mmetsp:Transcript_27692/g.54321  ORF Transcript_27692/g.54321 Transcript_27692/m.54321 type:complete len:160 (-) Transcript_27692:2703-3182(-)
MRMEGMEGDEEGRRQRKRQADRDGPFDLRAIQANHFFLWNSMSSFSFSLPDFFPLCFLPLNNQKSVRSLITHTHTHAHTRTHAHMHQSDIPIDQEDKQKTNAAIEEKREQIETREEREPSRTITQDIEIETGRDKENERKEKKRQKEKTKLDPARFALI